MPRRKQPDKALGIAEKIPDPSDPTRDPGFLPPEQKVRWWQYKIRRELLTDEEWPLSYLAMLLEPPKDATDSMHLRFWFIDYRTRIDIPDHDLSSIADMSRQQRQLWRDAVNRMKAACYDGAMRKLETSIGPCIPRKDFLKWAFTQGYQLPTEWYGEVIKTQANNGDIGKPIAKERFYEAALEEIGMRRETARDRLKDAQKTGHLPQLLCQADIPKFVDYCRDNPLKHSYDNSYRNRKSGT